MANNNNPTKLPEVRAADFNNTRKMFRKTRAPMDHATYTSAGSPFYGISRDSLDVTTKIFKKKDVMLLYEQKVQALQDKFKPTLEETTVKLKTHQISLPGADPKHLHNLKLTEVIDETSRTLHNFLKPRP